MNKTTYISLAAVIVIIVGFLLYYAHAKSTPAVVGNTVTYSCDAGKSITATFSTTGTDEVGLVLSDGRKLTEPHAISADGARYANADESFVFWNVGTTAFITEGAGTLATTTYTNCVQQQPTNQNTAATTTTYTNSQYGFEITYPNTLTTDTTFASSYVLRSQWRSEAGPNSTGTPVVSIPVLRINEGGVATGQPYPLSFDAEVHVGVSSNPADVADCLQPDADFTNEPEKDVTIGGVVFKDFSFQDDAMMTYLQGESYRAVHNGMCYAVEQIKTGSDYKDPTMTAGYTDAQLTAYYDEAGAILQTFQFTK